MKTQFFKCKFTKPNIKKIQFKKIVVKIYKNINNLEFIKFFLEKNSKKVYLYLPFFRKFSNCFPKYF